MKRKIHKSNLNTEARLERLGQYNSEKARGLVHTEEWKALMKVEQDWYYREIAGKH